MLKLQKLSKNYGSLQALKEVSLEVPKGSVYGLLGPNGSGKTTLLSIILGAARAGSGQFEWEGEAANSVSRRAGGLLEKPNFLPKNNIASQLEMLAVLRGIPATIRKERVQAVLLQTGIAEATNRPFRTLSLGMKQRLGIAGVLLPDPDVLVLDEPTNGLDPQGIIDIRNLILKLAAEGRTIILASHMLDEIEKVCTHVAILNKGILIQTSVVERKGGAESGMLILATLPQHTSQLEQLLKTHPHCRSVLFNAERGYFRAMFKGEAGGPAGVNKMLANEGIYLTELRAETSSLEASFLKAVGGTS